MRILLISGEFPPMQGGVGDYTETRARAMEAQGQDVWVLVPDSLRDAYPEDGGLPWHVRPAIGSWGWSCWRQVVSVLREVNPDVVNIQYQAAAYNMRIPAINFVPWRIGCLSERPAVVVTFHDLKSPYLFPKAGLLRPWVVSQLARHSDAAILTNSQDLATASGWFRAPRPRLPGDAGVLRIDPETGRETQAPGRPFVHQIPIGSNIAPAPPAGFERDAWRARLGYTPDQFVWAYFGFLNESKGGETLVRALSLARHTSCPIGVAESVLLMIGGREGSSDATNRAYAAKVERLMRVSGVERQVQWTGFVAEEEVSAALMSADILMLPYRDGASLRRGSLMAGLAHGCAVVTTTPRSPVGELRQDENVLLVASEDPQGLCDAAMRLQRDAQLRLRIGAGAKELAQRFTWERIAQRTVDEVFRPLVAKTSRL